MAVSPVRATLEDMADDSPVSPALDLLTGADTADMLAAALTSVGGELSGWRVREIDHRPAGRTTASYTANVTWPDGAVREEILGASVRPSSDPGGQRLPSADRLVVTDGSHEVEVWRYPHDPELPALAAACYPHTVAGVFASLGLNIDRPDLRVLSYRPRRRAVVAVTSGSRRWYLKVVRPDSAKVLHDRHAALADAGLPVPRCVGWSTDGLLVFDELPGTPLRTALLGRGPVCSPGELVALLDQLPKRMADMPRRRPWAANVSHYAGVLADALPAEAERIRSLAHAIDDGLAGDEPGSEPTHGDFYDAQIMVADGRICGLLDTDTAGPGRRADDLGCLLAHLSVLTTLPHRDPLVTARLETTLRSWLSVFEERVDPTELRLRAAAVTVSLATGPFRTQEPGWQETTTTRLQVAEHWISAAHSGHRRF